MAITAPSQHAAPHEKGLRKPAILPVRKPMQGTRRVSLFEREIRIRLSAAAVEILFSAASVLSEGQVDGDRYFGSTMITIDLRRASVYLSEACDSATAESVERLVATDIRVLDHSRELAMAEGQRLAGCPLDRVQIDVRVNRSGRHFHLDVDVEAMTREMP